MSIGTHVITNYQKHHSPALTTIMEDEVLDEDLKVIRPLNEVKNDNINYHQIIKNHLKVDLKTGVDNPGHIKSQITYISYDQTHEEFQTKEMMKKS